MRTLLQEQKIYSSSELQQFLLGLEAKYNIESAKEKYHNLVNFSTNATVPYHQWFTYREGFAGELIKELISMSGAIPGECIIDPFCGSGTTNVVAMLSGYNSLGLDVNPMSAFISNAKIDHYSHSDIEEVRKLLSNLSDISEIKISSSYKDIKKYFSKTNFNELVQIKSFIDSLEESKSKNILLVAFDSIIMDCSDRKRDGNGLKKHPSLVTNVKEYFFKKVNLILDDILSTSIPDTSIGGCFYNTAYNLFQEYNEHLKDLPAGAIIFSPPYANSFDYFESYKLELVFGGYAKSIAGISALRKKAIRSFIGAEKQESCDLYVDLIANEIERAIPEKEKETEKKDTRTRKVPNMIRGYFSDMHEVIRQCAKVLPKGKKTYIVVDQSAYCGIIVPTDLLLAYFGEQEGFRVGKIIECRNARTSTQQLSKYPYLKTALRESIVELIKE